MGTQPEQAETAPMPHQFKAHPAHPAVDYLVRLHADLLSGDADGDWGVLRSR